jgi:hypothetical protein
VIIRRIEIKTEDIFEKIRLDLEEENELGVQ